MPALPSFMDHMQLNPRSVLRPEYLNYSRVHSSTSDQFVAPPFEKRLNTNTAPLYTTENRSFRRKYLRDAIHHPYSRSNCRSLESSPQNGATLRNPSSLRCGPLAVPLRSGYSSPDSDGPSRIYPSSSLTYTPKFASDLRNTRSESDVLVRDVEENAVSSRSHSHGQSEQLRRSRESNTFALIDAQLSCLPLSQVRDMYLQSRSGANFSGSSAARTTKKVNLSVVHTIVRFRLKEYLHDIQDHTNFLLDTLLSSTFEDYHPGMRNELASKLFGISRLPCAADCQFCPGLLSRQTRSRRRNRLNERFTTDKVPLIVSPCPLDSSVRPFSSSSSNNSTTPMLTASDAPSESHDFSPSSNLKDDIDQDLNKIERKSFSEEDKATPVDILDDLNNIKLTPGQFYLPTDCSTLEKPLLSYHLNCDPFEPKRARSRLDSFTLRIVDEFGANDWLAEGIEVGPSGDEPVDLHTLVNDSACEGILKPEEFLFGSEFEPIDLLHSFVADRCSDANHLSNS
ncbi:unnamed protein product [Dicrocoelium dendriticum]|nr:unnamed protein product [Dicrocoelium dendriticum]